jgi:hypothetical protein
MRVGFGLKASIVLGMISTLALVWPASGLAGQIVYAHEDGSASSLRVMGDSGNYPRALIGDDTVDGIGNPTEPDLQPGSTELAFQGTGSLAGASGCGLNCVGVYTLIAGHITRVSPAIEACSSATECDTETDSNPSLSANGEVIYDHVGTYTGSACYSYYCGPNGDVSSVFLEQPALGGGTPTEWQTPSAIMNEEQFQPTSPDAPFADPGDPSLIAYAGLQDYNCDSLDTDFSCDPLTLDQSDGTGAYNVTDADCGIGGGPCSSSGDLTILGWSPTGQYILVDFGADSRTPGVWIFKNQPYAYTGALDGSDEPIYGTGWWVWRPQAGSAVGQGGAITSDTPGQGKVIFTYDGDIVSILGSCWGDKPTITTGEPVPETVSPSCTKGTKLTADGHDNYPTWTSSNTPITIGNAPPPAAPTSKLGRVTHSRTSVSVKLSCSAGTGRCRDIVGLATLETLRGSKVIAVAAAKTTHRSKIVAGKSISVAAGKSTTVKLSLNSTGRRLLNKFRKLPMLLVAVQGSKTVGAERVTLTLPRQKTRAGKKHHKG